MTRNKISAILASIALVPVVGATAACFPEPCQGLSVSQQDKDAAAAGYEVEKEDSMGNECQLSSDGTTWSVDD